MPYKSGLALGLVLLFSQLTLAQTPDQPEKIPLPKSDGSVADPAIMQSIETYRRGSLFYADADYLLYWVKHGPSPVLLTTAPNNGRNIDPRNGNTVLTGGILGEPGTVTLFTGRDIDYQTFSGVRGAFGFNLGDDAFWSLEIGGFMLPKNSIDYSNFGGANGTPLLTVPFLDAATGLNNSLDISSQDVNGVPYLRGGIRIQSDIFVWGYEANVVAHSIRTGDRSVDLIAGFRCLDLTENLRIDQTVTPTADGNITIQNPNAGFGKDNYFNVLANKSVFINDQFGTRNQFYGGQVGGRFNWAMGALSADLNMKVALGVTHMQASIDGTSIAEATNKGGVNVTTPGGVFALKSNIGNYAQNQFTVVPEIGLNLKYALTPQLAIRLGYSAMYWSNVARPGAQIDPVLNSKLVPTGGLQGFAGNTTAFQFGQEQGRPFFAFRDTAFWAHGINVGMEFRY